MCRVRQVGPRLQWRLMQSWSAHQDDKGAPQVRRLTNGMQLHKCTKR